ncbi:MAG: hypothetical protein JWN30_1680 [Bacilli bacterium]|nr:hypothetical protein [Bacilli bacterium]
MGSGNSVLLLQLFEVVYFFLCLGVGYALSRFLLRKWLGQEQMAARRTLHLVLAALFAVIAIICLLTGSALLPIWIGRNVIFFSGYYLGLVRFTRSQ